MAANICKQKNDQRELQYGCIHL